MKIIHREAETEAITQKVAEAMEDCGMDVFSITHDGKAFHVWGKSEEGVDMNKLDRRISERILEG